MPKGCRWSSLGCGDQVLDRTGLGELAHGYWMGLEFAGIAGFVQPRHGPGRSHRDASDAR
jgi:hypothetical protein